MTGNSLRPLVLALSGGGARCAAQAGVLNVLAEAGLTVGAAVGVSAGGLVAVLHGLGYAPEAIRDAIAETHLLDVWELDARRRAILGDARAHARLRALVGDHTFDDLGLRVAVLGIEMETGREVCLDSGPLWLALAATMAMPGLFPPQVVGGANLWDGGLLNPLPVDVAEGFASLSGGPVVAVDLVSGSLQPDGGQPQLFEARGPMRYATEVARRLGLLDVAGVVHQAALLASLRLLNANLKAHPPHVLLQPELPAVGLFAFDLADQAYAAGQEAARAALPELMAVAAR